VLTRRRDAPLITFGQCLLACHASLYRYARALCHDPARAEDLVQETYLRALAANRRPEGNQFEEVRPWAFTILRNIWHNEHRRRLHEAGLADAGEALTDHDGETPLSLLERKFLRSEIVQAIDTLPEVLREALILRDVEGLSYAEMARVLECPPGTVMSRLFRARHLLRKILAQFAPSSHEVER